MAYEYYERKDDCPPVEQLVWEKVIVDCGDFGGIKAFSFTELLALSSAINLQLETVRYAQGAGGGR